jgi:putative FmdB family regulatory protein
VPLYVYDCNACDHRFEVFLRSSSAVAPETCESCGSTSISRSVSGFAIARSELDRLRTLDPRYKQMVDEAVKSTPEADPERHLKKMIPFSAASEVGDPINF